MRIYLAPSVSLPDRALHPVENWKGWTVSFAWHWPLAMSLAKDVGVSVRLMVPVLTIANVQFDCPRMKPRVVYDLLAVRPKRCTAQRPVTQTAMARILCLLVPLLGLREGLPPRLLGSCDMPVGVRMDRSL